MFLFIEDLGKMVCDPIPWHNWPQIGLLTKNRPKKGVYLLHLELILRCVQFLVLFGHQIDDPHFQKKKKGS